MNRVFLLLVFIILLTGCSEWVLRNYGGEKKEIIGNLQEIYEYNESFLVRGEVKIGNKSVGLGYGLFPYTFSCPNNHADNRSSHCYLTCQSEAKNIIVGDLPAEIKDSTKIATFGHEMRGDIYHIYLKSDYFVYCEIPIKDSFVIKRDWYRWIDTGLLLVLSSTICIVSRKGASISGTF
jgi:hypothetical protein